MPLDRSGKEGLANFLGTNLRRDNLSLADTEVAKVLNADLHATPGVVRLRRGRVSALPDGTSTLLSAVRAIGRHNAILYQVAGGTWHRNYLPILHGLHGEYLSTMLSYRPLNDTQTWTFLADRAVMYKDNGSDLELWGIAPPLLAPTLAVGAAGSLTGDYGYVYTYARVTSDGDLAHESNPSPSPNAIALTSDRLDVTVVASTDPQVTHIRGYRTVADGTIYLFDQQVTNASATITSSQADNALGAAVEDDNDVPPNYAFIAEYQNHFFGVRDANNPNYLGYSKRFRPESWPSDQFIVLGTPSDPLQGAVNMSGFLGVFSRKTKYRVSGNATSGFAHAEAMNTRGTPAPQALCATSQGVLFWAKDGIWLTNFLSPDRELSTAIFPLFDGEAPNGYLPIDWTFVQEFSLAEYKKRFYAGYVDTSGTRMLAIYSQDTQHWYHYVQPARSLYYDELGEALLMGGTNGVVYILERGTEDIDGEDVINLDVVFARRAGGDRFVRKHFTYVRFDVHVYEPSNAFVFVDEVMIRQIPLTGGRLGRELERLPAQAMGYTWEVRIVGPCDVYGIEMLYAPLEQA